MIYLIGLLGMAGLAMAFVPGFESQDEGEDSEADVQTERDDDSAGQADGGLDGDTEEGATDTNALAVMLDAAMQDAPLPDDSADLQQGGPDAETLVGTDGDDFIDAQGGDDELLGDAGNDTLLGGDGADIAISDAGDDVIYGGTGNDALHGRADNDILNGGAGQDSLFGGDGDDTLFGGDDAEDWLIGADGDDALMVGSGDHAHGGDGSDTFFLTDAAASDSAADLMDFNSDEDVVVLMVDAQQADAEVTMTLSEDDPAQTELRLDGEIVATLATEEAPDPDDIQLLVGSL